MPDIGRPRSFQAAGQSSAILRAMRSIVSFNQIRRHITIRPRPMATRHVDQLPRRTVLHPCKRLGHQGKHAELRSRAERRAR